MPVAPPVLHSVEIEQVGRVWLREGTSDAAVLEQIFHTEEFNISTAPQFDWIRSEYAATLRSGQTPLIIDCGANIGLTALYYAQHLPRARIVGIEPARENVEVARLNTRHNPLIEILEAAVYDQSVRLELVDPGAEKFAFRIQESRSSAQASIEAITLNALIQRYGCERALIVKVDIEGAEAELFRSNTDWLDRTALLTVETHDWLFPGKGTSQTLFAALAGRTFEVIHKGEYISFFFTDKKR
jgi:FkbM family methyltransferase